MESRAGWPDTSVGGKTAENVELGASMRGLALRILGQRIAILLKGLTCFRCLIGPSSFPCWQARWAALSQLRLWKLSPFEEKSRSGRSPLPRQLSWFWARLKLSRLSHAR